MTRAQQLMSWLALAALLVASAACAAPRRVVLLYDERVELPGLSALDGAIAEGLQAGSPDPIEVYREALDLSRFGSAEHLERLSNYLRAKYAGIKIDVAVAAMGPSLDFLLAQGDGIFPGTPIVFCGVDRRELPGQGLPANVTGVMLKRQFAPTLEDALRLQPDIERVVVVAGTAAFDTGLLRQAREEFARYEGRIAFDYLTNASLPDVLVRVSTLPPHTVVLYTTMFRDGAGEPQVPHRVVEKIAAAANAPVYAFIDQYLGLGIVGGDLYSLHEQGSEVTAIALRILRGENAGAIAPIETASSQPMFDARQLRRWRLDETRLPAGAVVAFRQPSVWTQYRSYVIAAITIVVLQSLTIVALLVQRSRRRRAEIEAQQRRMELAHAARLATLGQFTAAMAHEVNQPLGAILANVDAAELLITGAGVSPDEMRQILADIRSDDLRASEVIKRVRALLAKREVARAPLDVNEMVAEVLAILRVEAAQRNTELGFVPVIDLPTVVGDRVQLQQVVLNLVVNAMDAMSDTLVSRRRVTVRTTLRGDGDVEVAVSDQGNGIKPDDMPKLFDSFYTTKEHGMGLGLSIARSIVEAHGGRIWAESSPQGATFRFAIPRDGKPHLRLPAIHSEARPRRPSEVPGA